MIHMSLLSGLIKKKCQKNVRYKNWTKNKQKFERTSENLENYCLMSLLKEIQNYMTPWTQNTKKCEMSQDCYTVMYNP